MGNFGIFVNKNSNFLYAGLGGDFQGYKSTYAPPIFLVLRTGPTLLTAPPFLLSSRSLSMTSVSGSPRISPNLAKGSTSRGDFLLDMVEDSFVGLVKFYYRNFPFIRIHITGKFGSLFLEPIFIIFNVNHLDHDHFFPGLYMQ